MVHQRNVGSQQDREVHGHEGPRRSRGLVRGPLEGLEVRDRLPEEVRVTVLPARGQGALLPQADTGPERGPLRGRGAGPGRGGGVLEAKIFLRRYVYVQSWVKLSCSVPRMKMFRCMPQKCTM